MMFLPKPFPLALAALGGLVLVSALAGIALTFTQSPPAWFFMSFEVVVALAAGFLIALGLGRIAEGPAITMLCCAGAIGAGSLLGWQATGRQIDGKSITWLVAFRGLAAALLVLAAAGELIIRNPRSVLPRVGRGLIATALLLILLGALRMGLGSKLAALSSNSPALGLVAWIVVGITGGGLLSAAGHYLITGFAIGVNSWDARRAASPSTDPRPQPPAGATGG